MILFLQIKLNYGVGNQAVLGGGLRDGTKVPSGRLAMFCFFTQVVILMCLHYHHSLSCTFKCGTLFGVFLGCILHF